MIGLSVLPAGPGRVWIGVSTDLATVQFEMPVAYAVALRERLDTAIRQAEPAQSLADLLG